VVTTLVLTRKPDTFFTSPLFQDQQGRWGTLLVLQGSAVTGVSIDEQAGSGTAGIAVPGGVLTITTADGSAVNEINRFATIERWGGYVQLKPQHYKAKVYKQGAYGLRYEPTNSAVAELKVTGGKCFRVLGGITDKEQAILIHEAPHVGYLKGCIGPRNLDDKSLRVSGTAHFAMQYLFGIAPKPSQLFVTDF